MSLLEMFGALCATYLFVKFFWVLGRTIRVIFWNVPPPEETVFNTVKDFANTFLLIWLLEAFNLWMDATLKDD